MLFWKEVVCYFVLPANKINEQKPKFKKRSGFFMLFSHLRLSQRMDEPVEG